MDCTEDDSKRSVADVKVESLPDTLIGAAGSTGAYAYSSGAVVIKQALTP